MLTNVWPTSRTASYTGHTVPMMAPASKMGRGTSELVIGIRVGIEIHPVSKFSLQFQGRVAKRRLTYPDRQCHTRCHTLSLTYIDGVCYYAALLSPAQEGILYSGCRVSGPSSSRDFESELVLLARASGDVVCNYSPRVDRSAVDALSPPLGEISIRHRSGCVGTRSFLFRTLAPSCCQDLEARHCVDPLRS